MLFVLFSRVFLACLWESCVEDTLKVKSLIGVWMNLKELLWFKRWVLAIFRS